MTLRQFFNEVDQACVEAGFTLELVEEAQKIWLDTNRSYEAYGNKEFYEMMKKIYLVLREKGFNHYPDLTG